MTLPDWFEAARFGMFIHWGHSSARGCELSWPMAGGNPALPQCAPLPVGEYQSTAAAFGPRRFDPREWARAARRAGMQYAVFTAKHHDGFAMFHTSAAGGSDFSVEHAPFGRDIVREYVDAFRAEGLRVGLYFSLIDWPHPDYPPLTDEHRPYFPGNWPRPTAEEWERYLEFMFGQVRELLTNYGPIDLLWFDGQWEHTAEEWRADDLAKMIRELQPGIVINDRLPASPAGRPAGEAGSPGGDYETPEQFVPAQPPERPWEVCLTMNESWGYNPSDTRYKSARSIVHRLCEIAGKGGRFLLNVGPDGDGVIPHEQAERLDAIAGWMSRNGESIHGSGPGLEPWQFYGPSTRKGDTVYLHLLMRPYETVAVRGLPVRRVRRVRAVADGRELAFDTRCAILDQLLNSDPMGELTVEVPEDVIDPYATVLAVEIAPGA